MKPICPPIGMHLLVDLFGVNPKMLSDEAGLESLLRRAATAAGARVLGSYFRSFGAGAGVTGVVLLAESHISVHTWPEIGLAAADIFMCGAAAPDRALALLVEELAPARQDVQKMARGCAAAVPPSSFV